MCFKKYIYLYIFIVYIYIAVVRDVRVNVSSGRLSSVISIMGVDGVVGVVLVGVDVWLPTTLSSLNSGIFKPKRLAIFSLTSNGFTTLEMTSSILRNGSSRYLSI
jgi:hypothetical protein